MTLSGAAASSSWGIGSCMRSAAAAARLKLIQRLRLPWQRLRVAGGGSKSSCGTEWRTGFHHQPGHRLRLVPDRARADLLLQVDLKAARTRLNVRPHHHRVLRRPSNSHRSGQHSPESGRESQATWTGNVCCDGGTYHPAFRPLRHSSQQYRMLVRPTQLDTHRT